MPERTWQMDFEAFLGGISLLFILPPKANFKYIFTFKSFRKLYQTVH